MKHLKRNATIMAAAIIVTPVISTTSIWALPNNGNSVKAHEQSYISRLQKRINTDRLMDGVDALATGDDARLSGLSGEKLAAENIAKEFKSLGLKTEIREFDLGKAASGGKGYVNVGGESYKVESFNGGTSFEAGFEKEIVNVGYGNSDEEYQDKNVEGKVALVERGGSGDATFANKVKVANKNGAAALIIYNNATGDIIPWNTAGNSKIPVLGMSNEDGTKLLNNLNGDNTLTLTPDIDIEYIEHGVSRNVVAEIPAAKNPKKAKTIVVGAHFDSVNCPGANDNATGTSVLMEAARLLSTPDMKKAFNYNIQFVAFGTEELGLSGSKVFVEELKESGEIYNVQAMINMDMVGTGDTMTIRQYSSDVTETSKIAESHVQKNDIKYYGRVTSGSSASDHYNFDIAGIPATCFMVNRDPYYHTDQDTIDKITPVNLHNTANVLVSTLIDMQDMTPRVHNPKDVKVVPNQVINEELGDK